MTELDADGRSHLESEIVHWREATDALADLESVASAEAWASLEQYLQVQVRGRLSGVVANLSLEADHLHASIGSHDVDRLRQDLLRLRSRYLQVEAILDFYGDAINTRTSPALRRLLRGFDVLATDSMAATLTVVGQDPVPALVYVETGLGASILPAYVRLWDRGHPSPAAAIKVTRHNLSFPTALLHETGHQVAHLTGWKGELADALRATVALHSTEAADIWSSWASELAADVHAFSQAGWGAVAALANVVDGPSSVVFRMRLGAPHPFPFMRVLFNVALCRSWFGRGPWDRILRAWVARHPLPQAAPSEIADLVRVSQKAMPAIVDTCTRQPMEAFRGAPLSSILDPRRVSPSALADLRNDAGGSLETSSYLRRREPLRVFAELSTRALIDPPNARAHRARLRSWIGDLGEGSTAYRSTRNHAAA